MKGELQLTAAERQEKVRKKRAEIVNYIHKYYIDPKTKLPHPIARLDGAIDDVKVRRVSILVYFFDLPSLSLPFSFLLSLSLYLISTVWIQRLQLTSKLRIV